MLEFVIRRGSEEEAWVEGPQDSIRTPLNDDSDNSEASEMEDLEDGAADEDQNSEASSSSSSSDEDEEGPLDDEETLSLAESVALRDIDAWRPSPEVGAQIDGGAPVQVPFYIE